MRVALAALTASSDECRTAVSSKDLDKRFRKYCGKLGMDGDGSASLEQVKQPLTSGLKGERDFNRGLLRAFWRDSCWEKEGMGTECAMGLDFMSPTEFAISLVQLLGLFLSRPTFCVRVRVVCEMCVCVLVCVFVCVAFVTEDRKSVTKAIDWPL